ncbi:MAG: hypothetical protein ACRBK7_19140 [Acidimicrobiales bacterium]
MADHGSEALRGAARKRFALKEAVSRVETAAASASAEPNWRPELLGRLGELHEALAQHVAKVEAADGLMAELTRLAPRLVGQIDQVRAEHPVLCQQAELTAGLVADEGVESEAIRVSVLELLAGVARHRQRGADLVYEGYDVDLGGG